MKTKELSARQEAKSFVADGSLREVLKSNQLNKISDEAIQKIIDACSFVFKV